MEKPTYPHVGFFYFAELNAWDRHLRSQSPYAAMRLCSAFLVSTNSCGR